MGEIGIQNLIITKNPPKISGETIDTDENKITFICAKDVKDAKDSEDSIPINCICNNNRSITVNIKEKIFEDARKINEYFITPEVYNLSFQKIKDGTYDSDQLEEDFLNSFWYQRLESIQKNLANEQFTPLDKIMNLRDASDQYQAYSTQFYEIKDEAYEKLKKIYH